MVRAGKIRPLAVFAEKRSPKYPDIPIPRELGVDIPLLFNYSGIVAPPGTPDELVKVLEAAFVKAAADKEYVEWFKKTATADLLPLPAKEYKKEFERLYHLTEKYKKYLKE
jgi:tripartite-type tricarboxylate transporter receptor subunit TctC